MLIGTTGFLFLHTSTELAPEEDQGALFSLVTGAAICDRRLHHALRRRDRQADARTSPRSPTRFSVAGSGAANSGFAAWVLKPWGERSRSQARGSAGDPGAAQQGRRPAGLRLRDPLAARHRRRPADLLRHPVDRLGRPRLRAGRGDQAAGDGVRQVHRRAGFALLRQAAGAGADRPPARRGARRLGRRHRQHADPAGRRERRLASSSRDARAYDIIPQVPQRYRFNPENLGTFFVRSQAGAMVPLSSVVTIKTQASAPAIEQFNQLNSATLSGPAAAGRDHRRRPADLAGDRRPGNCRRAISSSTPASRAPRSRPAIRC